MKRFLNHVPVELLLILLLAACQANGTTAARTPTLRPTVSASATHTSLPTPTVTPRTTLTPSPAPSETPRVEPTLPPYTSNSYAAGLSADGRFLAFTSWDDHLVPNDTNGMPDAFVFDRDTETVERVSVTSDGKELQGWTLALSISADGRYVLFSSDSRSYPGGLLLHDRQTRQTDLIRLDQTQEKGKFIGFNGQLSADGQYVLVEAHTSFSGELYIYLFNRSTNQAQKLNQAPDGSPANGDSGSATMTPDGRWIAFLSQASNLTPGDQPCTEPAWRCTDIFIYDRVSEQLEWIPVGYGMIMGGPGDRVSLSADGRWVAYNFMDDQYQFQVKVYDRQTKQVETVCTKEQGKCFSHSPSLSADGRWLAFASHQVFIQDRQTGQIQQASVTRTGQPADGDSGIITLQGEGFSSDVQLSADGKWIAFSSQASNMLPVGVKKQTCTLLAMDAYPCYDLFLHNRETGETRWVTSQRP